MINQIGGRGRVYRGHTGPISESREDCRYISGVVPFFPDSETTRRTAHGPEDKGKNYTHCLGPLPAML